MSAGKTTTPHLAEMDAITECKRQIEPLSPAARQRVISWLQAWAHDEQAESSRLGGYAIVPSGYHGANTIPV
jgi:hypothetical protein